MSICSQCGIVFVPGHVNQTLCSRECYKEKKRQYQQRPDVKEKQRQYHQRPDVKEKQRQYQQRKSHSVSLIDVFQDAKERLSIQEIMTRSEMSRKDVLLSINNSIQIGSIIREGDEYRLNPLFAPCVNGVYESWKAAQGVKV